MHYVSRQDFDAIAAADKYYNLERWALYQAAVTVIREINPSSALELGPYRLPIVVDGDTMDRRADLRPTILHDASETPWPVQRNYDVFVGLQVWEHLGDRQQDAFDEVRRFASHAVLSFPYRWDCPKNPSHHRISEQTIRRWTCGCEPESIQEIPSVTNHRRILYHFDLS